MSILKIIHTRHASIGLMITALILTFSYFTPCYASLESSPNVTITVGLGNEDVRGNDSFALQEAADRLSHIAPNGGGTLLIKSGIYNMFDSLHVHVPMVVCGEGEGTVLIKCPQFRTRILQKNNLSILDLEDSGSLIPGMGITIMDNINNSCFNISVNSIIAINGKEIKLGRPLDREFNTSGGQAFVQNSFPILSCCNVDSVTIENLTVDGNFDENSNNRIDGCRGGGIYLFKSKNCTIRNCEVRNFNGDGISWQETENITVERCRIHDNNGFGLHPGTISRKTLVRNNWVIRNAQDGLFLCWYVTDGRFEDNTIVDNGRNGVSLGYGDCDNVFSSNIIWRNAGNGIYFRNEPSGLCANRCRLKDNVIVDNGITNLNQTGVGIYIDGETCDTLLENNTISDRIFQQNSSAQNIAIQTSKSVRNVTVVGVEKITGEVIGQIKIL